MGTGEQSQTEDGSDRFLCLTLFLCTIILFQDEDETAGGGMHDRAENLG
jgi:hypothetical protein